MQLGLKICTYILTAAALCQAGIGADKPAPLSKEAAMWAHRISGKIITIKGSQLQVETREKHTVSVDASAAVKNRRVNPYLQGSMATIYGTYDARGVLHAQSIQRAKNLPSSWPPDR
jgi:hypothetical protein